MFSKLLQYNLKPNLRGHRGIKEHTWPNFLLTGRQNTGLALDNHMHISVFSLNDETDCPAVHCFGS